MLDGLPRERPGAVALLSGGLDSAAMVGLALSAGDEIWPLFVRQGFCWEDEEAAAIERFLGSFGGEARARLHPLTSVSLTVPATFSARWALDGGAAAPGAETPDEAVYLPGRNLALLTQGASLAYAVGARRVMIGILAGNPFPDSRPEFFRAFERAAFEATRWSVRVESPLAGSKKREVLESARGLALELTLSCIRPRAGRHCGACNKCAERRKAFIEAGIPDPTGYVAGKRTLRS